MTDLHTDRFADEVHIITGAASGFGRATAQRFAAEGGHVVCADYNTAGAEETAELITEAGGSALSVHVDVSDPVLVQEMSDHALDAYGRIDGLFANAGVPGSGTLSTLDVNEWQRTLSINLTGPMLCAQAVLPAMQEAGRGAILFTASISGVRAFPNQAAYAASKGGVIALGRQLALDLAPQGIRVNCISPGLIRTSVVEQIYQRREEETGQSWEEALAVMQSRYPLGLGQISDVTAAVSFLQSNEARWVTGTNHIVDGGFTA